MAMEITRQNTGTMATSQNPNNQVMPGDLATMVDYMQPYISRFRDVSSPLNLMLDPQKISVGSSSTLRISSTGLGERTIHKVEGSIILKNVDAGAVTVKFAPEFPFNIISSVNTQINGNTSITNASPLSYTMEKMRRDRNFSINPMDERVCRVSLGNNPQNSSLIAATDADISVTKYSGVSLAANSTTEIKFMFMFEVPYVLNRDTLIGMLPLQNNSTFATITYIAASSMISQNPITPFYVSSGDLNKVQYDPSNSNMSVRARYDFWSVPGDFQTYQHLIMNSFQIIEQPGNTFNTTGPGALSFQFPLNSYLLAAYFRVRDKNGKLVDSHKVFDALRLEYNGNVYPFKSDMDIHIYNQFTDYGENEFNKYGTILWDGTNTGDQLNFADSAGWVDLYNTSNPTFYADVIAGAVELPATYTFVRTQIVPSDVTQR